MVNLTLFDINGKIIVKKDRIILSGKSTERINVNNLATGIYFVRLASDKFMYVNKVMHK